MTDYCEDCQEIKRLEFQIESTDLAIQRGQQAQMNKDIEHEIMIQNLTTRMDTMSQDFVEFKQEVKDDIQSIKNDIPVMFDNAVNKLLAKIAKWLIVGIVGFIVFVILTITLAFNRPHIVAGLEELTKKVQTMEIQQP